MVKEEQLLLLLMVYELPELKRIEGNSAAAVPEMVLEAPQKVIIPVAADVLPPLVFQFP